jgi:hypothetical protein
MGNEATADSGMMKIRLRLRFGYGGGARLTDKNASATQNQTCAQKIGMECAASVEK